MLTRQSVSNNLHRWMRMEHSQMKKNVDVLRQESRDIWEQCVLLQRHLRDLKLTFNQEDTTSEHQTQQQQQKVGTSSWVRLVLLSISQWLPLCSSTHPLSNAHSQPAADLMDSFLCLCTRLLGR